MNDEVGVRDPFEFIAQDETEEPPLGGCQSKF